MTTIQLIMYIIAVFAAIATFILFIYALSRAQMKGWLHEVEKFLTNKYKNNEQTKEE